MTEDDDINAELAAEHVAQAQAREAFIRSPGIDAKGWSALLEQAGLPAEVIPQILATGRPAARLVTTPVTIPLARGSSKVGGTPDLREGSTWPSKGERPLAFVAQVRLTEVPASVRTSLHLAADGLLSFFYDNEVQPWGYDPEEDRGGWAVVFTPTLEGLASLPFPEELDEENCRFPELHVRLLEELRLPSHFTPGLEPVTLDHDALERYDVDVFRAVEGTHEGVAAHYLGGHAQPIQDPPEWEAALNMNGVNTGAPVKRTPEIKRLAATAADLRLLLQIDSDDLMNVMWGDTGRLYVWMYEADLQAQAYDRAWCVLQCG